MVPVVAPFAIPASILERPAPQSDTEKRGRALESEAERLQRDVRAAVVRNTQAVDNSKKQVQEVRSFEERSRDTLRDLMADMGPRDGIRD